MANALTGEGVSSATEKELSRFLNVGQFSKSWSTLGFSRLGEVREARCGGKASQLGCNGASKAYDHVMALRCRYITLSLWTLSSLSDGLRFGVQT